MTRFQEETAEPTTASVPLSHLSVELGHLYLEDFAGGPPVLRALMRQVAPWAVAARAGLPERARLSTCFLVDDYFSTPLSPAQALPMLLDAAGESGLDIDYLVRESACAEADELRLAEVVAGRLVPDPPPGTNGFRPSTKDSGWLANGVRSPRPVDGGQAMRTVVWRPPSENGFRRHSVFVDVELWSEEGPTRTYSCASHAAIWQLLRLGLLRMYGRPVLTPRAAPELWPDTWSELPPVVQLNPQARPFAAYRTLSVLPNTFSNTELAVRTILSQVSVEQAVVAQLEERARGERLSLPPEIVDRIGYVFTTSS